MAVVSAGRPLLALSEVRGQVERIEIRTRPDQVGSSVRVIGRLVEFDAATACALIERGGERLRIDVREMPDARFQLGSMLQFIGEAKRSGDDAPDDVYVRARVVRNADNVDMAAYEKAVQLTREFVEQLET